MFSDTKYSVWALLIPVLWLLTFSVPHLDQGDFRTDTGRYAAVGLQMWDRGDLLFSYTQPESPYFRKPPLGFWIHGAVMKLFGVDLTVARAPSIVAALGTLLLTFWWVLKQGNRTWAFATALVLAITYEFVRRTREISLDHWQLLFMLAATIVVLQAVQRRENGWGGATLAGVLFGLSLLVKPLGGGIAFGIAGLWLIATRRLDKRTFIQMLWVFVVMMVVGGAWHVYMYAEFGQAFIDGYLGGEVIDRLEGEVNPVGWSYYPQLWLATYWPWLPIFLWGLFAVYSQRQQQRPGERDVLWLALIWLVMWGLVLILLPDKRPRYALVMYPAAAIISAYGLMSWSWAKKWLEKKPSLWQVIAPSLLLMILAVAPVRVQAPADPDWQALFAWMDNQGIEPKALWEYHIYDGDAGRFYLRYRQWPHAAIDRLTLQPKPVPSGSLLLYTDSIQPPQTQTVLFQAGKLTVARVPD